MIFSCVEKLKFSFFGMFTREATRGSTNLRLHFDPKDEGFPEPGTLKLNRVDEETRLLIAED